MCLELYVIVQLGRDKMDKMDGVSKEGRPEEKPCLKSGAHMKKDKKGGQKYEEEVRHC